MRRLFLLMTFIFMEMQSPIEAKEYALEQLGIFANALNIEGGRVARDKLRDDQIWANLCVVLDQPLCTGEDLDVITRENPYPLKESSLEAFDEDRANLAYYNILRYYLQHAHAIAGKEKSHTVRIMVQVHRNSSGPTHIALLKKLVAQILAEPCIEVSWVYGAEPLSLEKYVLQDIVISISMVAGLDHSSTSGSLMLPSIFIPLDLRCMQLMCKHAYQIDNHLWHILLDMIRKQNPEENAQVIVNFASPNVNKQPSSCRSLKLDDFQRGVNVEVNGMFYPQQLPAYFTLEK